MSKKVVVLISGGMDSAVILYKALHEFDEVHALSVDYGQRHHIELEYLGKLLVDAQVVAKARGVKLVHKEIPLTFIPHIAPTSSLTNNEIDNPDVRTVRGEAQPVSYVPNRNMLFLSICAAYAEGHGVNVIQNGLAKVDSLAGYWDGSHEFIVKFNEVLSLNRDKRIKFVAPLAELSKKQIVEEGIRLGVDFTKCYTCYSGKVPCDAYTASSSLRIQGFIEAGYIDPMPYIQDLSGTWLKFNCKPITNTTKNNG